jgi:hypothetical protein
MMGQGRMMDGGFLVQGYMGGGLGLIVMLLVAAVTVFAFWSIFAKAGYAGAWGLLALLPFAQIFLLLFLALADWPSRRQPAEGTE